MLSAALEIHCCLQADAFNQRVYFAAFGISASAPRTLPHSAVIAAGLHDLDTVMRLCKFLRMEEPHFDISWDLLYVRDFIHLGNFTL